MSVYQFLSSDMPFQNLDNSSIEILSIEEAENRNIPMPNWYSKDMDISCTKKILLYAPNEESLNELQITDDGNSHYAKRYSNKSHHVALQWRYSNERAQQIIEYIREHLISCSEIELWSVWLDREAESVIKRRIIDSLTISDINEITNYDPFEKPYCLVIYK